MVTLSNFHIDKISQNSVRLNADITTDIELIPTFMYKKISEEEWQISEATEGNITEDTVLQKEIHGLEEFKNYECKIVVTEVVE